MFDNVSQPSPFFLEGPLPRTVLPTRLLVHILVHQDRSIPRFQLVIHPAGTMDLADHPGWDLYDVKEADGFTTPLSFYPE